ncbi:hypothetical protein AT01_2654 [Yersinia aldovae 670-83]|nr:hypothetical protein AT01_2654 [Yersinia aldovae 670-83]
MGETAIAAEQGEPHCALDGVAGGKTYDGIFHVINTTPQITIPAVSYNPAKLGRTAYLSGSD